MGLILRQIPSELKRDHHERFDWDNRQYSHNVPLNFWELHRPNLWVVRTEFANQYPDIVKQYVGVLDEAVKAYRTDPKAATAALAKELNITPAETESSVKELVWLDSTEQKEPKYLGSTDQPGELAKILKSQADFAVIQKKITSAPDLAVYQQNLYTKAL